MIAARRSSLLCVAGKRDW